MRTKNKYYGRDDDRDLADDGVEVAMSLHDEHNHPRHQVKHMEFSPAMYNHNGVLGIYHSGMDNNLTRANKLTTIRKIKLGKKKNIVLSVDMNEPRYDGTKMKKITIPKAEMKEPARFNSNFSMDYVNNHIKKMLGKKKK
jgi:hypothetical protein